MNSMSMTMSSTSSMSTSTPMGSSNSMMMMMTPYFHFGRTEYLIFETWYPSSNGAIVGACMGLFVFCILERCLAAYRRSLEFQWRARALSDLRRSSSLEGTEDSKEEGTSVSALSARAHPRLIPPFTPSRDVFRGILEAVQATFSYSLMLAVMTFNGAYIISILVGLGVGELLVGRIGYY